MAKLSAAISGLTKFLRNDAKMTKQETSQILQELQGKQGFDDNAAQTLTAHLQDKFKAAMGGSNASHADPDNLKPFLGVGNLGGEIWQRGQNAGAFNSEWAKRNFAQYSNLNSYDKYFNNQLTKAVRGAQVDYDAIGRKMQRQEQSKALTEELNAAKSGYEDSTLPDKIKLDNANKAYVDSLNEEINVANVQDNVYTAKSNNLSHKQQASKEISQQLSLNQSGDTSRYAKNIAGEEAIMRKTINNDLLNELSPMEIEQARQAGYDLKTPGSIRDAIDYTRGYKQKMADSATSAGQVNKIFLNARSSEEARQAALNLFNTDVEKQKQILKEYFNNTGTKEDTFTKILENANITDDEITKRAIERSSDKKTQEEFLDKIKATRQFANDPTIENFKNIGIKAPNDTAKDFVENFQRYKALKQEDEIRQKISNGSWGSGKNLQEAAGSAQDQAVASAASDFSGAFPSFEKAMSGDGNVSLDRAILRSKMGGDPSDWGFEGGSNHLLTNQEKDFNKFIKDLRKSNASPEEKQKLFNDKLFEIQKNIAEGPGMSDFFFGNQLHTGAIGAAAIMGTMGVAFGGRKSNAELYSSPF